VYDITGSIESGCAGAQNPPGLAAGSRGPLGNVSAPESEPRGQMTGSGGAFVAAPLDDFGDWAT
jgi:hypothetical protein